MTPTELSRRLYAHGLGRSTVNDYLAAILAADRWCRERGWTLNTVPGPVLMQFTAGLPPSWASRKRYRSALGHYWQATRRRQPPIGALPTPRKPRGACRALSEDDARLLRKTATAWDGPAGLAVLLGLHMALRRFEIAKIRKADFRQSGAWLVVVGKGGSVAELPVFPMLRGPIRQQVTATDSAYLFPGRMANRPVCPMTVSTWVADVTATAGVTATSHQLRHTALATLNDATGDLRGTMEFARHKNPETTLIYTRTTRSRLVEMSEVLADRLA
jgi:site-specific recombinase XerD